MLRPLRAPPRAPVALLPLPPGPGWQYRPSATTCARSGPGPPCARLRPLGVGPGLSVACGGGGWAVPPHPPGCAAVFRVLHPRSHGDPPLHWSGLLTKGRVRRAALAGAPIFSYI